MTRTKLDAMDEGGFTLIELLVVILIIGVLAAIAIPAFLSQTNKAYDSSAKTLAQTAQTAAETYGTENGGSYASISVEALHTIEPTINKESEKEATKGPVVTKAESKSSNKGYLVTVLAQKTKDEFSIERTSEGTIVRTCKQTEASGTSGCKSSSW